ncbi:MAG: M50 family metallopeptidase, partial [Patescibacteria group bacterium]
MTILIFILILLILILSHEAGHFFTAKSFGIKVEEFGFGIPPRIAGIKKGETLYSFNLLPFGGFVKIFGEEGQEKENHRSFGSKNALEKSAVLLAGVGANIFLAFLIFSAVSFLGSPKVILEENIAIYPDAKITILEVVAGSPADNVGIQIGDKIKNISGITPKNLREVQEIVKENSGKNIEIVLERNGNVIAKNVIPRADYPKSEGPLGVALSWTRIEKSAWYKSPVEGAKTTWNTFWGTVFGFSQAVKNLVLGERQSIQIAGPVGI